MNLYVTFSGLMTVAAIVAAYQLGRMIATPKDKKELRGPWPPGGILQFGWDAWRIPLIVIIGVTVLFNVLWPIVRASGITRRMSMGMGGGYGGGYGNMGMGGGGGYGY